MNPAALLFVLAAPTAAHASPEDLPGDGLPHLLDVAFLGQFARGYGTDPAVRRMGTFDVRTRAHLGRAPSYCLGVDGRIGGSTDGVVYGATAYPVGFGARWGAGNVVSLCGGAGFDRTGDGVPLAAVFPAELSLAIDLGVVRPLLWVRPAWSAGEAVRREGTFISFVDELDIGLVVRLSRQHRYWSTVSAGGGLSIGVTYRELMDTRMIGVVLGFAFAGEK